MAKRKRLNIVVTSNVSSLSGSETEADGATESHEEPQPPHGQRIVRGPTRMLEVWDMPENERICVKVDDLGRPIGDEGKTLTSFIGSMVRRSQLAPINFIKWKDMPNSYKEEMWRTIESKFTFVPELSETTKKVLKENMSEKWRQWKSEIKSKGYDESKTEEELVTHIPDPRLDASQYRDLVHYWCSEESQKISKINKENRAKLEDLHCIGTKSFPRFIHEKTQAAGGVAPSRAQIYIDSRKKKDGSFVNEKAAEAIEKMQKYLSEASSSQSSQACSSWQNDVYSRVKGPEKKGRIRCAVKVSTSTRSIASSSQQTEEVQSLKDKIHYLEGNLANTVEHLENAVEQIQGTAEKVQGLEGLVSALLSYIHIEMPNNQLGNILSASGLFINRQVPDAGSVPDATQNGGGGYSDSIRPPNAKSR